MTNTVSEVVGIKMPKPFVLKDKVDCAFPDLLMGAELEIEGCDHDSEWYIERVSKLGWQVTTDGSLRGSNITRYGHNGGNAFEFISKPMEQQTLLASLSSFFGITGFNEENYTDRCSVHFHVNCTNLTFDQVGAVAMLYTVVEEILFKFVGEHREHNIYCIPWAQCRMNHDFVSKLQYNGVDTVKRWQKYTALNLLPLLEHGTIEFRHMHGTADMKKLTTWINLIGSIFKYGTSTELTALIEEIKGLNSSSEYEVFFNRVMGGYLPYTDDYRASLEAGVITAKYALINWSKDSKGKTMPVPKAPVIPDDTVGLWAANAVAAPRAWDAAMAPQAAVQNPIRFRNDTGRNRFVPWPRTGTRVVLENDHFRAGESDTLAATNRRFWNMDNVQDISGRLRTRVTILGQPNEANIPAPQVMAFDIEALEDDNEE